MRLDPPPGDLEVSDAFCGRGAKGACELAGLGGKRGRGREMQRSCTYACRVIEEGRRKSGRPAGRPVTVGQISGFVLANKCGGRPCHA